MGNAHRLSIGHRQASTSHVAAAPPCSTFPISAQSASQATALLTGSRTTLTNDLRKITPGRAQYTHLLDAHDASVLDDIIVWWHPRDDGEPDVFDVMPNASNTDDVLAALGGVETTHDRAVIAVQGPDAKTILATVFPEAAATGRFFVTHCDWQRRKVRRRRDGLHRGAWRRDCCPDGFSRIAVGRTPQRRNRSGRPRRARHAPTRIGAAAPRPRARSRYHLVASRSGLGCGLGKANFHRQGSGSDRAQRMVLPDVCLASPPTGGGQLAPVALCVVNGASVGEVTSGNFSPILGHGIASSVPPTDNG